MTNYIPKHFSIQEFVPKHLYYEFEHNSNILWGLFDERVLKGADWLRQIVGRPLYVNTWAYPRYSQRLGQVRQWSGLRTTESPYYHMNSYHSKGMAIDFIVDGVSAETVRRKLLEVDSPYFTRIEKGVNWLHLDTGKPNPRHTGNKLYAFGKGYISAARPPQTSKGTNA